jgi:hypothetical protein
LEEIQRDQCAVVNMRADNKSDNGKADDHGQTGEVETFDKVGKDISEVEVANLTLENRHDMEKKLLWKLDMRLLPLMMLICMRSRLHKRIAGNSC